MIIDRYIMREIIKPTMIICIVLVLIFGCYIATRFWEDAVHGLLTGAAVFQLILLRIIIALEVLLPTTFYLSVVIALGRLYHNGEITAMFAGGISMARITLAVFSLSLLVAAIVAVLSLYVRPWAWTQFFLLKARAEAQFDLTRMQSGNFYEVSDGDRVIFADKVTPRGRQAEGVFILNKKRTSLQVIHADRAIQHNDEKGDFPVISFKNGRLYEFSNSDRKGFIIEFENAVMPLRPDDPILPEHKVKAATTSALVPPRNLEETAELEWRIITPMSSILLALLAIPLSSSSPRQGRRTGTLLAIVIFAVYYNFSAITKKLVAQGGIAVLPGIFWGQLLLLACLVLLVWRPPFLRHWRRR
ncbi:LPS export ABC transporter permease LptF [Desulfoprunum benzoelyticum]|nr:LPS export ABC transporter permease LptF [Desulfoprunum benzoelyticum]